jgi:hypothetical protein
MSVNKVDPLSCEYHRGRRGPPNGDEHGLVGISHRQPDPHEHAGGQGVLGIFQFRDFARDIFALASAAVAGLTAIGEAHSVFEQGVEYGFAILGGNGLRVSCYADGPSHNAEDRCGNPAGAW